MNPNVDDDISRFLNGTPFAVAGASNSREKYGNRVLRCFWQAGRIAYPVNPWTDKVEGAPCFPNLSALPEPPHGVSLITPPEVSKGIVDQALALGVKHLWFQPGAEHPEAIDKARTAGCNVIAYGPCLLVVLRWRE